MAIQGETYTPHWGRVSFEHHCSHLPACNRLFVISTVKTCPAHKAEAVARCSEKRQSLASFSSRLACHGPAAQHVSPVAVRKEMVYDGWLIACSEAYIAGPPIAVTHGNGAKRSISEGLTLKDPTCAQCCRLIQMLSEVCFCM